METADFEKFLDSLYPKVRRIALKLNKGLSSLDDRDLAQEAAVFLWQHFNRGEFTGKTQSYILQGCYFHLQNHIRLSRDRFRRVCLDGQAGEEEGIEEMVSSSGGGDFREELDSRLLAEIIRNNGLTPGEKRLLPLMAQGLTVREIGRRVGLSHVMVVKMRKTIGAKCRKYLDLRV